MREKLKNPILWASIISTILLILSATGVIKIEDSTANTIVNSILSILSLMGVINSPSQLYTKDNEKNDLK
ncbi:MAG: phage holin [Clostridia bacterium]